MKKKNLKGIDTNTVVHCPTEGLAKQVLQIAHDAGYQWNNGESYLLLKNWTPYGEHTCYWIVSGEYCNSEWYRNRGFKILPAKEFIEMNTPQRSEDGTPQRSEDNPTSQRSFNLETYTPKGQIEGFPKEVIRRMLECQVEQGNEEDACVFETVRQSGALSKGFEWYKTKEGNDFWLNVITGKNFNLFFEKYPKQDHPKIYTVTREALGEIHRRVCSSWKANIEDLLREQRFNNEIEVPIHLIRQAWSDADPKHKEWLTKNGLELPKQKVTKTVERWVNIYPDNNISAIHNTKEKADKCAAHDRIDCVKITIPYQVEE